MTTIEKWAAALGVTISLGVVLGFLINLTSGLAISLHQQRLDSKLIHDRTQVLEAYSTKLDNVEEIQKTALSVVYINSDHVIVRAGEYLLKIPITKVEDLP